MKKTRVLIVDDEREFATTLAQRLQLRGYDAQVTFSTEEASAAIAEQQPDVILLDLRLPGVCGIEILMTIRNSAPGTEVILLTGHLDLAQSIEGVRLDSFNIIIKPFNIEELIEKIDRAGKSHA